MIINKSFLTLFVVFVDQMTKRLALHYSFTHGVYSVMNNIFKVKVCWNPGFSFGVGSSFYTWVLKFIIFAVCIGVFISWYKSKNKLETFMYSLILGGGISNLIDRFLYNAVLDFISLTIFGISFPIFNIADILITVGIILMLWKEAPSYRKK